MKSEDIGYCLKILGNWDLFISVRSENINEFHKFHKKLHKNFSKFIKKENINLETRTFETNLKILRNNDIPPLFLHESISSQKNYKNDKGNKIICLLNKNPLRTYSEISDKLRMSYKTTVKIIKDLKNKKIIKRNRAVINTDKLGYERHLFLVKLDLANDKKLKDFLDYLIKNKNINYIIECIGSWNIICNVYSKEIQELQNLSKELRSRFNRFITHIEFLRVLKNEKESFNKPSD